MNYRHAFHAGNHADVLKHVALLAICDALTAKPTPLFALDTHAGRGLYALDSNSAQRTGEAEGGIGRLLAAGEMSKEAVAAFGEGADHFESVPLLAASLAGLSPLAIAGRVYYCWLLAAAAVIFMLLPSRRGAGARAGERGSAKQS